MRSRNVRIVIGLAIAALVAGIAAVSAAGDVVELAQNPPQMEGGATPVPPPEPTPSTGDGFQLLGFTRNALPADSGVLNLTLACQQEFRNSRICRVEEIHQTVHVPAPPDFPYAWVQPCNTESATDRNCRSWTSRSASDMGTAIDLQLSYGGCAPRACDSVLVVACCGPVAARTAID